MSSENFSQHMDAVARQLLGEPNKHFTKPGVELRWGSKGSLSVDLKKGTFFDHGPNEGGGVLDLVVRVRKIRVEFTRQARGADVRCTLRTSRAGAGRKTPETAREAAEKNPSGTPRRVGPV